jgi:UDP-N-acetylmuramoyl-tripeptide--D-alanyl-D-alanine ligase
VEKGGVVYINDSYNASPASMRAALENLPKPEPGGRVIAALGRMGELGHLSKRSHEELGEIAALHADLLICIGEDTSYTAETFALSGKEAVLSDSFERFRLEVHGRARPGDVVLIKASNSLQLWRVLEE